MTAPLGADLTRIVSANCGFTWYELRGGCVAKISCVGGGNGSGVKNAVAVGGGVLLGNLTVVAVAVVAAAVARGEGRGVLVIGNCGVEHAPRIQSSE